MDAPRIPPVTDPSPEVVELYDRGGLRAPDGSPLNIFATLANHPALLRRWLVFATHVLSKSTLSPRDRELAILRVGVRCASRYEFAQHVVIARRSDISDDEIERVRIGPDDPAWTTHDAAILRAVDELHDVACISASTWQVLAESYTTEQLMDLVFAIGQYHLVSFALNSFGVQIDAGIPDVLEEPLRKDGEASGR